MPSGNAMSPGNEPARNAGGQLLLGPVSDRAFARWFFYSGKDSKT